MAPTTTTRRLLKEVAELSAATSNPNPTFYAAPVSDSDLHEWHFTLLGPPSPSPYAGGLYHGRISLPPQYPLKPPNFRFLTPSGRFEVNREICLSISGFHEETWMPAWGVRTALTALRSFMAEKGTAGQVGGLEASDEVRRRLALESRKWRCGECSRTNEDAMTEWWSHCKEAGVKVDEEGCDLGLEALPEGMNVSAFDRSKAKGKAKESSTSGDDAAANISNILKKEDIEQDSETLIDVSSKPSTTSEVQSERKPAELSSPSTQSRNLHTPESAQHLSSGNRQTDSIHSGSLSTLSSPGVQHHSGPQTRPQPSHQQALQNNNYITLDRAIAAVFLALCFMVLRRIFYRATTGGSGFGRGDDWDIGLSREY